MGRNAKVETGGMIIRLQHGTGIVLVDGLLMRLLEDTAAEDRPRLETLL